MAAAEDELPDDITSLSEYRRSDRQAAFLRVVDGYLIKGIPVLTQAGGELRGYVYTPGAQGPVYDSSFEMDDTTRQNYGLTEDVQQEFNRIINRRFNFPPALE